MRRAAPTHHRSSSSSSNSSNSSDSLHITRLRHHRSNNNSNNHRRPLSRPAPRPCSATITAPSTRHRAATLCPMPARPEQPLQGPTARGLVLRRRIRRPCRLWAAAICGRRAARRCQVRRRTATPRPVAPSAAAAAAAAAAIPFHRPKRRQYRALCNRITSTSTHSSKNNSSSHSSR